MNSLQIRKTDKEGESSVSVSSTIKLDSSYSNDDDADHVANDKENNTQNADHLIDNDNDDVASSALLKMLDAPTSANVDGEVTHQTKKTRNKVSSQSQQCDPKTCHIISFVTQREDERFEQEAYNIIRRKSIQNDFHVFSVSIWESCVVDLNTTDPRVIN